MMEDYHRYPELYRLKVNALTAAINNTKNCETVRKLFINFATRYTTTPFIWGQWLNFEKGIAESNKNYVKFANRMKEVALSHFYGEKFLTESIRGEGEEIGKRFSKTDRKFCKVITYPYYTEHFSHKEIQRGNIFLRNLENAMTFPHCHLESLYSLYEEYSYFISDKIKQIFKKNSTLCTQLMEAYKNEDIEQWFNLLKLRNDNQIIIQNMEYYISKKPWQKDAWKYYIKFLKTYNLKAAFGVYSRYCRFFIGDKIMKMQYQQEIIEFQQKTEHIDLKLVMDFAGILSDNSYKDLVKIFLQIKEKCFDIELIKTISQIQDIVEASIKIYKLSAESIVVVNFVFECLIDSDKPTKSVLNVKEFMDMLQILNSYQQNLKRLTTIQYSNVWFMDRNLDFMQLFDIYIFEDNSTKQFKALTINEPKRVKEFCSTKYSKANVKLQEFAFCADIMRYIEIDYHIRQILYQTCKYFFAKYQTPLCFRLEINNGDRSMIEYIDQSLKLSTYSFKIFTTQQNPNKFIFDNMIITNSVKITSFKNAYCFTQLSQVLKNLDIKYLTLMNQTLTMNDIILLNQNCKLIGCKLFKVNIYNSDGAFATVESVIENFSGVKKLQIGCESLIYTSSTSAKLSDLPAHTKFEEFAIFYATDLLNFTQFCSFLTKYTAAYCKFDVKFAHNYETYSEEFHKNVKLYLKQWTPKDKAPKRMNEFFKMLG